jgi:GC-rich sequence DNA-binding factor
LPVKPVKRGYVPTPSESSCPRNVCCANSPSVPVARPIPTIAPASTRIAKTLAEAQAAKIEAERTLEITARDLASLEEQDRDLRKEVERVEGKREWMEEFRGWVEMLGEFLEEKVGTQQIKGCERWLM